MEGVGNNRGRNGIAAVYMMTAVIGFSLLPILLAWGKAAEVPFLFNAGFRLGTGVGFAIFAAAFFPSLIRDFRIIRLVSGRVFQWSMLFIALNYFEFAFFAWSADFINIAVTVVIYETWPIFTIFLMAKLLEGEDFHRRISLGVIISIGVSFAGFLFVVASQFDGMIISGGIFDNSIKRLLFGVGLAGVAAIMGSFTAFAFKWGIDLRNAVPKEIAENHDVRFLTLFCVLIANVIGSVFAVPINVVAGVLGGESLSFASALISILVSGLVVHTCANTVWRLANIEADNLGINAMAYGVPVLSLLWLMLFFSAGEVRIDLLIIATAAIITANVLINFEAEIRLGFKALILSLWGCGAFVYLRDDLLQLLPSSGWEWAKGEIYLGTLAMSATVFILLLSFRVARLAGRIRDEYNALFRLFQDVDLLVRRNLIDSAIRQHILDLDGAHNPEALWRAYRRAGATLAAVGADLGSDDRARLADAEAQLNIIVHSRRHGIEFGELFALITFGSITVLLALGSRPEVVGWSGFLFEMFAFLFSAVMVFLVVNVQDLQGDRTARVLQWLPDSGSYGIVFRDARNRGFEQWTSVIIGLLVTAAYGVLLWQKWLL